MKVVHINTTDTGGGAAIAAHRLHLALLEKGIKSKMIVANKRTDELNIELAREGNIERHIYSKIRSLKEKIILYKYRNRKNKIIFSTGRYGIDISKHPSVLEADVIHLHWINSNYISLKVLRKLAKLEKKMVWTLHDSWAFTGGCHVRYGCTNYMNKCGNCLMLDSNKKNDLSRKIFNEKIKVYRSFKDLTIITPSNWLGNEVKKSYLLKKYPLKIIPNILDDRIFKPLDKEYSRYILNLDSNKNKKYILFGAISATETPYKGWEYLKKALEILKKEKRLIQNIELLVFGASYSKDIENLPFKTRFMGKIHDEYTLSLLYNAADVFVGPSLEEAFGQTFNEAIFCGTPAVGFENTGVEDIIEHKKNGYLAKYKNSKDLADGVLYCLNNLKNVKLKNERLKRNNILKEIINVYKN
ncbi:glycosyl transferase family 1 [Marinitoga sp. 1135]|uniref:glycosyltransferase n=1 Tax=Marinitoga sp. 1135 TaxID=1643333 RepID=UPI0015869638|nr:glycosyltransferase [Marinitoga sp. 1135]NUU95816.1 glycosyl transferase family 1 [Marinitoga sp. 1135]